MAGPEFQSQGMGSMRGGSSKGGRTDRVGTAMLTDKIWGVVGLLVVALIADEVYLVQWALICAPL